MAWPDHLLSLQEWERLPEQEGGRVELVEGVLHVSPQPILRHQLLTARLHAQLDAQLPPEWTPVPESEVVLDTGAAPTVRVPDLLVVSSVAVHLPRVGPDDVLLAVEVGSPGTRRTDRVMKLHEYAQAGIPRYWIVDTGTDGALQLDDFVLRAGVYERRGTHRSAVTLTLGGRGADLAVTVDLDAAARGI